MSRGPHDAPPEITRHVVERHAGDERIRVELPRDWIEKSSDEDIRRAIETKRAEQRE